jgi:hypothetical protein
MGGNVTKASVSISQRISGCANPATPINVQTGATPTLSMIHSRCALAISPKLSLSNFVTKSLVLTTSFNSAPTACNANSIFLPVSDLSNTGLWGGGGLPEDFQGLVVHRTFVEDAIGGCGGDACYPDGLADADGLAETVFCFKVVCGVVFLSGHFR